MIELKFKDYEKYKKKLESLEQIECVVEINTLCNREESIYRIEYRVGGTHEYIG